MSLNREKYQELANSLGKLHSDTANNYLEAATLRSRLASLQDFFGEQIIPLDAFDSREQSYRTEISKQLRLLEIDMMFFQGARQPATAQARLQTICDRLTTLMQYCDAILQP